MKLYLFIYTALIIGVTSFSQDKPANPKALDLFIQAKTLELQDNYIGAVQKYTEALKIENAPGIHYTLSKLYANVSQYQKALEEGIAALQLDPENLNYKENTADVYIILNDYSSALRLLQEISAKKPDDINILYNIGRLYEAIKQPSDAIKIYQKITDEFQYDEAVLNRMLEIYNGYKDYANAAATLEKLLALNPTDINIKYSIAAAYIKIPDYDNALKIYNEILEQNPKNREVQTEVIKIYFRQNRTDLAFEKFGAMLDKDSVDYDTKLGVALAFFDAGQQDSTALPVARTIFETLNTSYPEQWMPEYYLAYLDARDGNTLAAEQKMKQIIARADTSLEAHIQVGFFYYEKNRLSEALEIFKKGVSTFPDDFRLNFLTGNTYYRLGNQTAALPFLEKGLEKNPSDLNTLSTLGILYDNLNMDAECDKLYEQAFRYYPENVLLLNNYAYHLSERGVKLKEALEMSKKTIIQEPENSSYLDTYGWIFYKLKDYKNAKIYIEKAVKLGGNAVLYEHLGDVYEGLEDIPKALKWWNEGLQLDPENKDLKYKIAKYQ
jgi:tetratricopeptide (TPR) repeat protein